MRRNAGFLLFLLVAVGATAAEPTGLAISESVCTFIVRSDGGFRLVPSDTLRVLDPAPGPGPLALPADAPENRVAVVCQRNVAVIVPTDARVLDAGLDLMVTGKGKRDRPATLRLSASGQLASITVTDGKITDEERNLLEWANGAINAARGAPRAGGVGPLDVPAQATGAEQLRRFEEATAPYVEEARRTWPSARDRFLAGLPRGQRFFVVARLTGGARAFEQAFVRVERIADGVVTGTINSEIVGDSGHTRGQRISLPEAEIFDWVIARADGSEEGNVVGKFLDHWRP